VTYFIVALLIKGNWGEQMKVVFLDRDGTIIKDYEDIEWSKKTRPEFLPGSIRALKTLNDSGYQIIIVTNQYLINEGYITEAEFQQFHSKFLREVSSHKIEILDTFFCPHSDLDHCNCKKPKPGLIDAALRKYSSIDLQNSFMAGDSLADVGLAEHFDLPMYVINLDAHIDYKKCVKVSSLLECVDIIVRENEELTIDFQKYFDEEIEEITMLNPGYEDHGSDIWNVRTASGEYIVRASRMQDEPQNEFWWGCKKIFGIDPRNVHEMEGINVQIARQNSFPVPEVLCQFELNREYIMLEKLQGEMMQSFIGQPVEVLRDLGEGLAKIHSVSFDYVGNISGEFRIKMKDFHNHLWQAMDALITKFYWDNDAIKRVYLKINKELEALEAPKSTELVLVDIDPTQFLSDGKKISGLVDTEAYVIAPREFDFIGLEYILDQRAAIEFRKGYERVMPIPDLSKCRRPYRFLYRLLSVQGHIEIDKWMEQEILFD
jgi:histidinol-phosphate phosphatase family protein